MLVNQGVIWSSDRRKLGVLVVGENLRTCNIKYFIHSNSVSDMTEGGIVATAVGTW